MPGGCVPRVPGCRERSRRIVLGKRPWGARSQARTVPAAFPADWEPPWADASRTPLPSSPAFKNTLLRKNPPRAAGGGEGFGACIRLSQPACPAQGCLSQGGSSCPQGEAISRAGARWMLGARGWRWDGLRARGAAGLAGQEDLPFAALFFNPFLPLLVFIAHIFPVTVSLGFHPF